MVAPLRMRAVPGPRVAAAAVAALAAMAVLACTTRPAVAATSAPTTATLSLVATSPVLSEVDGHWTTTVLVQDTGLCATAVDFRLVLTTPADPPSVPGTAAVTPRPPAGCVLTAGAVSTVTVTFDKALPVVPSSAVLALQAATPTSVVAGPTTILLTVRRAIGLGRLVLLPLVVALGAAVLYLAVIGALLRHLRGQGDPWRASATSTWSFKDSPVTNITAIGAVFGAVITATGAVVSAFPGVPLYRFSMLNAVYAGLAALGPVVAALGSRQARGAGQGDGTSSSVLLGTRSLLAAGALTLMGLAGELTSLATLEWWSSAVLWARVLLMVGTGLAGLLMLVYAVPAVVSLFSPPAAAKPRAAGPALRFASEFAFSAPQERSGAI